MKRSTQICLTTTLLAGVILLLQTQVGFCQSFTLPAQTSGTNKLDLGAFRGGTVLSVQMAGQVYLGNNWNTWADGSLVCPVTEPEYAYANAGFPCYPTLKGGDGKNYFLGGSANYDGKSCGYGLTGIMTTDTTDPSAIRFGAVVGTFSPSPQRSDWFYIGLSNVMTIPPGGAHLFMAVNDPYYPNNQGQYSGVLSVLFPPALTLTKAPESTVLSSPVWAANFVLETATGLVQPHNWTPVTNPPVLRGDTLTVTVDSARDCCLFRLKQQDPALRCSSSHTRRRPPMNPQVRTPALLAHYQVPCS